MKKLFLLLLNYYYYFYFYLLLLLLLNQFHVKRVFLLTYQLRNFSIIDITVSKKRIRTN